MPALPRTARSTLPAAPGTLPPRMSDRQAPVLDEDGSTALFPLGEGGVRAEAIQDGVRTPTADGVP